MAKISPVTASQRYLEHIVAAWQDLHPEAPVAEQLVVLTVPASFDASARELTREAALAAGLPHDLVLLEEPQAAVYAWLADRGDRWRRALKLGDTLLVCDVGGGTTDLTLVTVAEEGGELVLRRMAVGNHLLVGGDNMDLALAHFVAGRFAEKGTKLDPWQSVALWHSCRNAKESLLADEGAAGEKYPISVLGRGSRLIGGTVTTEIDRQGVGTAPGRWLLPALQGQRSSSPADGFRFPRTWVCLTRPTRPLPATWPPSCRPMVRRRGSRSGRRTCSSTAACSRPTCCGIACWKCSVSGFPATPQARAPQMLEGRHDLDHAVARGAAYYGWAKHRGGLRIRGGTARAYYVGIETAGLAVPGAPRPLGRCVSCPTAWRKAPRRTCPRTRSA